MNTITHRTAIRFYAHLLKVIGWENDKGWGIVHYNNPAQSSMLWMGEDKCMIDREPTEFFINDGLDESHARSLLVAMCKEAIARVEKLN